MTIAVTILVAIISSGVLNTTVSYLLVNRTNSKQSEQDVKQALRLIMKDRLRFLCTHYIEQKWIYKDELEDIIAMHNCYHDNLKGNGYLDELMRRVKELEIR